MYLYIYDEDQLLEAMGVNNHSALDIANLIMEIQDKYGGAVDVLMTPKHSHNPMREKLGRCHDLSLAE